MESTTSELLLESQMEMTINKGIYWFSTDLRLTDNPGLSAAAGTLDEMICIYFYPRGSAQSTNNLSTHITSHRHSFLCQSLVALDHNLQSMGQHLSMPRGDPKEVITDLVKNYQLNHLFCSDDIDPYRHAVCQALRDELPQLKISIVGDNRLYAESALPFPVSELPGSFSKFRRKVEDISTQNSVPAPQVLPPPPDRSPDLIWCSELPPLTAGGLFKGGESAGVKHLQNYFSGEYASTYKQTRNHLDGTSESTQLSPWLANGCLSVRQVVSRLRQYELEVTSNQSTYWIFFELLWREYFQWYAKKYGDQLFAFSGINGIAPTTSFYPERFNKWCHGNTPFPIVNACMRQLNETGYMSNRGRQLVASCLVNELELDWRYGASYMEQQLIDFDIASNWGNWQYLAGVGADPRGRRHFNLDKQTQLYDPEHSFIHRWRGFQGTVQLDSVDAADWPITQAH